jgi:hypothetical protein
MPNCLDSTETILLNSVRNKWGINSGEDMMGIVLSQKIMEKLV